MSQTSVKEINVAVLIPSIEGAAVPYMSAVASLTGSSHMGRSKTLAIWFSAKLKQKEIRTQHTDLA